MKNNVWIVSELYYPEQTSTGHFLTKIAEGLANDFRIQVLCAQPTYSQRGLRAPHRELRAGTKIIRCWSTTFDRRKLLLRICNALTLSASMLIIALRQISKDDIVVVVTNPPVLPFIFWLVTKLKGAHQVLLVHDVYPEVLLRSGILKKQGFFFRVLSLMHRRLLLAVKRIIVLGRDVKLLLLERVPERDSEIEVIPHWADLEEIHPLARSEVSILREFSLEQNFVVQYTGNLGRTHQPELILKLAQRLGPDSPIRWLICGSGARARPFEQQCSKLKLKNVHFLDRVDRERLGDLLNACDIALICLQPGMCGVSVPSRMYNIFAAGKPLIALADRDSELAQVILEEQIGYVLPVGDIEALGNLLQQLAHAREELQIMGQRARGLVERCYSFDLILEQYRTLLSEISSEISMMQEEEA